MKSGRGRQEGFTYVAVLCAVAICSVGLMLGAQSFVAARELQTLDDVRWAGEQYRQAIGGFYRSPVGSVNLYPREIEDLAKDPRYLYTKRHIRRLYSNPASANGSWIVLRDVDGTVRGVASTVKVRGEARRLEFVFRPPGK